MHVCLLKNTEYLLYEFKNVYPAGSRVLRVCYMLVIIQHTDKRHTTG
jgi:hypothetical protein